MEAIHENVGKLHCNCSNFLIIQSYEPIFSELFYLGLKRSFPVSFVLGANPGVESYYHSNSITHSKKLDFQFTIFFVETFF